MDKAPQVAWHSLPVEKVLTELGSEISGISFSAAENRRQRYGFNSLPTAKPQSILRRFLRQFHNILIYILLLSALIALFLQYYVDASVILAVVFLNAIIGALQEGKAEQALDKIRDLLALHATVRRDGRVQQVLASELVPGDIVLLKSGDKVPADLRLLEVKSLQIEEAALTGESLPVDKNSDESMVDAVLGDRHSMAYSSTMVVYGRGVGVVVATGLHTEVGRISKMLDDRMSISTPLLKQMDRFGWWLTAAILLLAAITAAVGIWVWKDSSHTLFMAIVGLVVAAIPEGLPPIMTIILALGVLRMAKQNAIIRRLPAVETMGSVTTICTDKTGTLTRNELNVSKIVTSMGDYKVSNAEIDSGFFSFSMNNAQIDLANCSDLARSICGVLLCNDAEIAHGEKDAEKAYGNPMDVALINLALQANVDIDLVRNSFPRMDLIPFESQNKFMATLHHDHNGNGFVYVKGAPEKILRMCELEMLDGQLANLRHNYWQDEINNMAREGLRVIAIGFKKVDGKKRDLQFDDMQQGEFVLLALLGLIDPPRLESFVAVKRCFDAGISVKMITGDYAATARTIAKQLEMRNSDAVLTGDAIDKLSQVELSQLVDTINVYARTTPEHKLRLVRALKARGHVVAMTGDGVNDAPALQKADIGIAMGQRGTEAAKEASAMILADDNFATISNAVEAGRNIYENLKKVITYILPTNLAESMAVVLAILCGVTLPITPVQILWINMVTTVALAMTLGFEPNEDGLMSKSPRSRHEPILTPFLVWRIIFVSLLLLAAVFGQFLFYNFFQTNLNVIRTIVVNMLVFGEVVYLFNCRHLTQPVWSKGAFFANKTIWFGIGLISVLQVAITYLPFMQHFFGTAAIGWHHWLHIFAFGILLFMIVELEKFLLRKRKKS